MKYPIDSHDFLLFIQGLCRNRNYTEAIHLCELRLQDRPKERAETLRFLSHVAYAENKGEMEKHYLLESLQIDSRNEATQHALLRHFLKRGQFTDVIRQAENLIEIDATAKRDSFTPLAYAYMACSYFRMGYFKEARKCLLRCPDLDGGFTFFSDRVMKLEEIRQAINHS